MSGGHQIGFLRYRQMDGQGSLFWGGGGKKKKKMSSEMSGGKEGQLGRDSTQDEAGLAPGGISATRR